MEMTKDTSMRVDTGPSRWYYGLAILVFIIGVTLSGMFLWRSLLSPASDGALIGGALMILLGSGVATIWIAAGTFSRRRKAKARAQLPASELAAIQSDWHAPSELLAGPLPRSVRLTLTGFVKFPLGVAIFYTSVGSFAAVTAPKWPLSADSLQAVGTILLPWTVLLLLPWLFVLLACRGVRPQVLGLWVFFLGVAFTILFCVATQWSPVAAERMGWLIFGWMAALIGCPIFWRIAFQKNLLEVGRPAAAAVTGMSKVSISRGPPAVRVTYQFLDAAGNVVQGTDISTSEMWKQRWQEWESARHASISWEDLPQGKMGLLGFLRWRLERRPSRSPRAATVSPISDALQTVITVLYDPKDPRRNTFYPADLVKIVGTADPAEKTP